MIVAKGKDEIDIEADAPELIDLADTAATFATRVEGMATAYWSARAASKAVQVAAEASQTIKLFQKSQASNIAAAKSALPIVPIATVAALMGAVPIAAMVAIAGTAKAANAAKDYAIAYDAKVDTSKAAFATAAIASRAYEGYATQEDPAAEFMFAAHADIISMHEISEVSNEFSVKLPLWPKAEPNWYENLVAYVLVKHSIELPLWPDIEPSKYSSLVDAIESSIVDACEKLAKE